jgi:c-di-GMP-binding flagellar brake protein YcgR
MFIERRASCRINIACKISMVLGEKQIVLNCHTENLSTDGIMVIIEENITPSTVVDLELSVWDKEKPLKCKGQVIWFNEIAPKETKPHLFNTGIKFTEISDSDKEEIGKFIQYIIATWH